MTWNDLTIAALKRFWFQGCSCSEIARLLNIHHGLSVTRNAVVGKAHRLGLAGTRPDNLPCGRKYPVLARPPPTPRPAVVTPEPPPPPEPEPPPVPPSKPAVPVTTLTITNGQCRWPIGDPKEPDFHYCAEATTDLNVYCKAHMRKAYQPQPHQQRRADKIAAIARNARAGEAA